MERLVYKIADRSLWEAAEVRGVFDGMPIDFADGYIHLSSAEQAPEVARLYFAGNGDLVLAAIRAADCGPALRWEVSRGGALFPHLYAPLDLALVEFAVPLPLGADGVHVFPDMATGETGR